MAIGSGGREREQALMRDALAPDPGISRRAGLLSALAGGSALSLIGSVVQQGSMLIAYVLLGRILGSTAFGQFGLVHGLLVAVGVFSAWGIPQAVVRFVATGDNHPGLVAAAARKVLVRVNLVAGLCLLFGGPWIARGLLGNPGLVSSVWAGIVFVLAQVAIQLVVALEQGRMEFRRAAVINGTNGLAFLVGGIIGALGGGVFGAILGVGLAASLLALVLTRQGASVPSSRGPVPDELASRIARFSRLTLVSAGLVWPVLFLGQAMLQRASGYEEVALFAAARPWFQGIILIPTIVARTSLPLAASAFARGDGDGLRRLIVGGGLAGLLSVLPFAVLLLLLPDWVSSFYGSGFEGMASVLRVLAGAALVIGVHLSFGQMPAVVDRMGIGVAINVLWAAVFLASGWFLVASGAIGLAWAFLLAYAVNAGVTIASALILMRGASQ